MLFNILKGKLRIISTIIIFTHKTLIKIGSLFCVVLKAATTSLPVIVLRKLIFDSRSNQKDLKWLQDHIYEILSCLGDSETATEPADLKAMFVVCVFESPGLNISRGQG